MKAIAALTLGVLCACGRTEPVRPPAAEVVSPDAGRPDAGLLDAGSCGIPIDATVAVLIALTADNRRALWVNGVLLERSDAEWYSPTTHSVPVWSHPGRENVIAVEATNLSTQAGFDRGLLLSVALDASTLVSDGSWRQRGVNDGGWSPSNAAWLQPGFDDSDWGFAVAQAPNGSAPWGSSAPIDGAAWWIWSYGSNVRGKANVEPVLFRLSVYVSPDGGLSSTPSPCP